MNKTSSGYILIKSPDHPNRTKLGYVREHRLVMEKHLGRYLSKNEVLHHINGIKTDNRIENLILFSQHANHRKLHTLKAEKKWSRNYTECIVCGTTEKKHSSKGKCKRCYERLRMAPYRTWRDPRFKKGHKVNLGRIQSEETRQKIREKLKGVHNSPATEFKRRTS